eukprot:2504318-Prymnesium_polylepis.1
MRVRVCAYVVRGAGRSSCRESTARRLTATTATTTAMTRRRGLARCTCTPLASTPRCAGAPPRTPPEPRPPTSRPSIPLCFCRHSRHSPNRGVAGAWPGRGTPWCVRSLWGGVSVRFGR